VGTAVSLDAIGLRHGTDKASNYHGYLSVYQQEISLVLEAKGSLLELGWEDGASMRTWREWLPEGWTVTGIDIVAKEALPGVYFARGSQDDPIFLSSVVQGWGPFDVIVDDASHESPRTITSFQLLWPHLKPGGLYFIEDVLTSYLPAWTVSGLTTMQFLDKLVEQLHRGEAGDIARVSFWSGLALIQKAA
jgi:hypothetical protein